MASDVLAIIIAVVFGGANLTVLTAIFFRLGRGASRFEALAQDIVDVVKRLERLEEIFFSKGDKT